MGLTYLFCARATSAARSMRAWSCFMFSFIGVAGGLCPKWPARSVDDRHRCAFKKSDRGHQAGWRTYS